LIPSGGNYFSVVLNILIFILNSILITINFN